MLHCYILKYAGSFNVREKRKCRENEVVENNDAEGDVKYAFILKAKEFTKMTFNKRKEKKTHERRINKQEGKSEQISSPHSKQ